MRHKLSKEKGFSLASSEESELYNNKPNGFYEALRELGFYRVFETYYKDEYQCHQFYCTGFLNAQNGYEWLLSVNEDYELEDDLSNLKDIKFDLFIELKGSDKWERKDKHMLTANIEEILAYSLVKDQQELDYARRYGSKE